MASNLPGCVRRIEIFVLMPCPMWPEINKAFQYPHMTGYDAACEVWGPA